MRNSFGTVINVSGLGHGMYKCILSYWRIFMACFCFSLFGIGGLTLRIFVFPLMYFFVWRPQQRIYVARTVIRVTFRSFITLMRYAGVLSYEMHGLERLERRGLLIVANHPTLLDTVFLMAFVKNADCIVKGGLWNNLFTGGPIRAAGYISNQSREGTLKACIQSLHEGSNLIIFPEGTRTPKNGVITLQRGASHVAVRGRYNVTPVIIQCSPPALGKGDKWWQLPLQRIHFIIRVQEDIVVRPFLYEGHNDALHARYFNRYLHDYFVKEKQIHAVA